mmetsp:Transcript_38451/g.90353  ORF Transcript_38451/g.90353 Transcript_38451/m.90353 type:complete len:689 (-) Transcript_38451:643-2709(-)
MLVHSYIHSDAYATERANEYAAARAGVRDGRQSPEEFGASRESPGGREGRFEGECWSVCREGDGELERRNDAPKSAPKLAAIVASILRARDAGPSGAVAKVGRRQRTLANVPIRDEFRTHTSRADIRVSIGGGGRFRSDFENRREIRGGNRQTGISPPSEFGNRWESPRSTSVRSNVRYPDADQRVPRADNQNGQWAADSQNGQWTADTRNGQSTPGSVSRHWSWLASPLRAQSADRVRMGSGQRTVSEQFTRTLGTDNQRTHTSEQAVIPDSRIAQSEAELARVGDAASWRVSTANAATAFAISNAAEQERDAERMRRSLVFTAGAGGWAAAAALEARGQCVATEVLVGDTQLRAARDAAAMEAAAGAAARADAEGARAEARRDREQLAVIGARFAQAAAAAADAEAAAAALRAALDAARTESADARRAATLARAEAAAVAEKYGQASERARKDAGAARQGAARSAARAEAAEAQMIELRKELLAAGKEHDERSVHADVRSTDRTPTRNLNARCARYSDSGGNAASTPGGGGTERSSRLSAGAAMQAREASMEVNQLRTELALLKARLTPAGHTVPDFHLERLLISADFAMVSASDTEAAAIGTEAARSDTDARAERAVAGREGADLTVASHREEVSLLKRKLEAAEKAVSDVAVIGRAMAASDSRVARTPQPLYLQGPKEPQLKGE